MKITINTKAAMLTLLLGGVIGTVAAFEIHTPPAKIQTVNIHHQRMTVDEKIAFDTENTVPQTILISATRLSQQQKMAMAFEDQNAQLMTMHNKISAAAAGSI
jgi:hypothetical protein